MIRGLVWAKMGRLLHDTETLLGHRGFGNGVEVGRKEFEKRGKDLQKCRLVVTKKVILGRIWGTGKVLTWRQGT